MPEVIRGRRDPAAVESLLRQLPEWFGIEEAIVRYVEDARQLPTYLAVEGNVLVGAVLLRRHFPCAAEIQLMLVHPGRQRRGIGRALLQSVEADLAADGVRWLQVKTLGPSKPSRAYATTRAFYEACGFDPLEEIAGLWVDDPCLIMVKLVE
ncbi:MAG: GNAT family N-acetyltransferase [Actinomycetota bacterium]|nr:GNAT family N-acetyltransferase [Actinomycetota bacterium]